MGVTMGGAVGVARGGAVGVAKGGALGMAVGCYGNAHTCTNAHSCHTNYTHNTIQTEIMHTCGVKMVGC